MRLLFLFFPVLSIALASHPTLDDIDEIEYGLINPIGPPPMLARALSKQGDDKLITFYVAGDRFLTIQNAGKPYSKCVEHHRIPLPVNNDKMKAFNTHGAPLDILQVQEELRIAQPVVVFFGDTPDSYYLQFFPENVIVFALPAEWFTTVQAK